MEKIQLKRFKGKRPNVPDFQSQSPGQIKNVHLIHEQPGRAQAVLKGWSVLCWLWWSSIRTAPVKPLGEIWRDEAAFRQDGSFGGENWDDPFKDEHRLNPQRGDRTWPPNVLNTWRSHGSGANHLLPLHKCLKRKKVFQNCTAKEFSVYESCASYLSFGIWRQPQHDVIPPGLWCDSNIRDI